MTLSRSYLPFLLLAAFTLFSIAWASLVAWRLPYDGGFWTSRDGWVTDVDPRGAAYAAGFRVGDRLVAIDGVPLDTLSGLYWGKQPGDKVAYLLERRGRRVEVSLELTTLPFRERVMQFEQLLVGPVFWLVSLVAWALRPFNGGTRRFFLISQTVAASIAINSLASTRWPWMFLFTDVSVLILPALALHFYSLFPDPLPSRIRLRLICIPYVLAVLLVVWTLVHAFLYGTGAVSQQLVFLRRLYILATLTATLGLLLRQPQVASEQTRRRRRLLIAGMAGSLLPFLTLSFVPQIFSGSPLIDAAWTVPALILLPLSYAYALSRGDLGRIDLLLNRSLAYLVTTGVLLGALAFAWLSLERFIFRSNGEELIILVLATIAATTYAPIRGRVQQMVDRLFYGGWYNYRTVVRTSSAQISQVQDREALVDRLLTIARSMRFQAAIFFWPKGRHLMVQGGYWYEDGLLPSWMLPMDGPLADHLTQRGFPLIRDALQTDLGTTGVWNRMDQNERDAVGEARLTVWIPLVSRAVLQGILVMGERQGEHLLDAEDLDILHTLAGQAAVASENVALLEALRERLAQVEQVRDELTETQRLLVRNSEMERSRLARELHDRPLQDLYGIRYKLIGLQRAINDKSGNSKFDDLQESLQSTISELREICGNLRSPNLQHGLDVAIRSHADRFEKEHPELDLHLDLMRDDQRLPEEHRAELYNICQEALQNVAKHADASRVMVQLQIDDEQAIVEIYDDGQGFQVPERWSELVREKHMGLVGVAERSEAIGGKLEVVSALGEGTILRVSVPILSNESEDEEAATSGATAQPRRDNE